MKKLLLLCLCINFYVAQAQNITAAEYFFDTDPGIGNGIAASVGVSGPVVNFTAAVPTAFPGGFHYVAIRVKDMNDVWSMSETRGFYITSPTANTTDIVAAEYFFDTDPGTGNGIPVSVGASGSTVNFAVAIPTAFAPGFHYLAIRTKDAEGKWGMFETRGFYITSPTTNTTNIIAAEYFFDTDPGPGNANPASIGASGTVINFTTAIPTALAPGFHYLAIRTKDAEGKWGMFETRGFYISAATANMPVITAAEYFFDTDPGVGNAAALSITSAANVVNENFSVPVPVGTSQGNHVLAIRVKDQNDHWSLFEYADIIVAGTLPLHLLSFNGQRVNENIALHWRTDNEINTSHFIVERSRDGATFTAIGNVRANNTGGTNEYSFDDIHPFDGINFYRLKQVDRDGKFKYSNIIRILMGDRNDAVKVYPNPAKDVLNIELVSTQKNILVNIFDEKGRLVDTRSVKNTDPLVINIEKLPKGHYWLRVSDGVKTNQTKFIKQ